MDEFPRRHRITVEEYYRMAEVGLLAPDARVELIDGEIIDMPPIGNPHGTAVSRLIELLTFAVHERANVRCQTTFVLGKYSAPEPDFLLLAYREDFYEHKVPGATDSLLIIEVSETSLRYDLQTKMRLYARHGIPELWVLDTAGKRLHVFRQPTDTGYKETLVIDQPTRVPIAALSDIDIDVSALLRAASSSADTPS
jgi:Uma2 family endonuclease